MRKQGIVAGVAIESRDITAVVNAIFDVELVLAVSGIYRDVVIVDAVGQLGDVVATAKRDDDVLVAKRIDVERTLCASLAQGHPGIADSSRIEAENAPEERGPARIGDWRDSGGLQREDVGERLSLEAEIGVDDARRVPEMDCVASCPAVHHNRDAAHVGGRRQDRACINRKAIQRESASYDRTKIDHVVAGAAVDGEGRVLAAVGALLAVRCVQINDVVRFAGVQHHRFHALVVQAVHATALDGCGVEVPCPAVPQRGSFAVEFVIDGEVLVAGVALVVQIQRVLRLRPFAVDAEFALNVVQRAFVLVSLRGADVHLVEAAAGQEFGR